MKYREFMGRLSGELPHVFLLAGEESFFIERAKQKLLARLAEGEADFGSVLQKFGEDQSVSTLTGILENVPFFSQKNVLLIQDTRLFKASKGEDKAAPKKNDEALLKLIEGMPSYSYLIFISREKADKRKKLYKAVEKHGLILEAEAIRAWNIGEWLDSKLREINKSLDREALGYFQGAVSIMQPISLEFLESEFNKLALYTKERRIGKADLVQVFSSLPEVSIFSLMDAVSERNARKSLSLLKRQLADGVYFTVILSLLIRQVRKLWEARLLMARGVRGKALAAPLGLAPFIAEKTGRQAAAFPEGVLKRALLELIDADYLLKTGQAGEERLEHAIIILCTSR